jgi:hypothetical protein
MSGGLTCNCSGEEVENVSTKQMLGWPFSVTEKKSFLQRFNYFCM